MNFDAVLAHVKGLGATHCQFVSPRLLVPELRIRSYCFEDKCGCFNKHLMCPPNTGSVGEIKRKFEAFNEGIMIQYSQSLDVRTDQEGLREAKLKLHNIILGTERYLQEEAGVPIAFGMIGGDCTLCDQCAGYRGEPCLYPDRARPSLEALAVDVIALLKGLNLDAEFYPDKITWTGMVLY